MSISIREVQVGRFFVCGYTVREIIREQGDDIFYYTYLLDTGEVFHETSDMCSKRQITRIADREAAPEEIARLRQAEARVSENMHANQIAKMILETVPNKWLLDEVKRRGLPVN